MPQSLSGVLVHIVFSTKGRTPWLRPQTVRTELYRYMATVLKDLDSPAVIINGVEDHVHILCRLSRTHTIAQVVESVKKRPSKWIKTKGDAYRLFQWQSGYCVFSVGRSAVEEVRRYILDQEEHHRSLSFQDEFRRFCARHGVDYDERYVWD